MYATTQISGKKAKKLVDGGAILIDVRTPVQFRDGTLPGAINLTSRQLSSLLKYPKTTKLVFFGDDTAISVTYACSLGFTDVYDLGALENWDKGSNKP